MPRTTTKYLLIEPRKIKPFFKKLAKNDHSVDDLLFKLIPKRGSIPKVRLEPLVLDRNNVIVKGHARWRAAILLGLASVPCVYSDADDETIKLDRLADAKAREFVGFINQKGEVWLA